MVELLLSLLGGNWLAAGHGHRRTGRFTTKDWVDFTAAEQVFEGTSNDYQVYTVQPFRLPEWSVCVL